MASAKKRRKKARKALKRTLENAGPLLRADLRLALFGLGLSRRKPVRQLARLAEATDQLPLVLLAATVMGAGQRRRDPVLRRAGARMLAALLFATAEKKLAKRMLSRTRPTALGERGTHSFSVGGPHRRATNAFPSGHMAGAVAVSRALGEDYPELARPLAAVLMTLAGLKVVRGDHFPGDLLAGVPVGLVAAQQARAIFPPRGSGPPLPSGDAAAL